MEEIDAPSPSYGTPARSRLPAPRWIFLCVSALLLVLLAILPPLLSVNRYQHRISTSIGASLGRPVHFDNVTLNLLPLPSFTITNFVVEEDPAFGAEPIIRANTVTATLRFISLWRRRVEFSRISFTDPSVNLVHDPVGRWNVEGILLQASQIETAPTAQRQAGNAPRFPYIEATGARFNLKQGIEKTPYSLTETEFALWQPDPQHWKMRLEGRPLRTDTSVSDTGALLMDMTLGRASSLGAVPLDLEASWRKTPLGEASRLLLARDLGLRGEMTISAAVHGTLMSSTFTTRVQLSQMRRSEFVPDQPLSVDLECNGTGERAFHALPQLRCSWPVPGSNGALVALAGSVPDTLRLGSADLQAGVSRLPAAALLNWIRIVSARVPQNLSATGLLSGSLSHDPDDASEWVGQATLPDLHLTGERFGQTPMAVGEVFLQTEPSGVASRPGRPGVSAAGMGVLLSPVRVPLGGRDPAVLEGRADRAGYTLHLSGMMVLPRLAALAAEIPQFGDGLAEVLPPGHGAGPIRLDLTAHRTWGGAQIWSETLPHPPSSTVRRGRGVPQGARR